MMFVAAFLGAVVGATVGAAIGFAIAHLLATAKDRLIYSYYLRDSTTSEVDDAV